MCAYRISEIATRTGFTASTLRFYEEAGLLAAPARTAAGYRDYGDETVERLRFIGRAKRVGLALDDIRELLELRDAGDCAPVHHRLRHLLGDKLAETGAQIAELTSFAAELRAVAERLEVPATPGPCTDSCTCTDIEPADRVRPTPVALGASPPAETRPAETPIACTLDADERSSRTAEWERLVSLATARQETTDGMVLRFPPDPELAGALAEVAAREQQCCRFFDFNLRITLAELSLDVRVPEAARDVLAWLLGAWR